jgi:ATPase
MLGIKIDVEAKTPVLGKEVSFQISEAGSAVNILISEEVIGKNVSIYIDDEFVFSSQVGKKARVKLDKRSENGRKIVNAILGVRNLKIYESKD